MKANRRTIARLGRDDTAVSPVIAVILMVAITVVLAATVYVWVSGFSDTGTQAPSASFRVAACDDTANTIIVKLVAGGPLNTNDMRAVVTAGDAESNAGAHVALFDTSFPQAGGDTTWDAGESVTFDTDSSDDATPPDLTAGTTYKIDLVHKPSKTSLGSLNVDC